MMRSGQVAIIGRPNVGKSTLLNAILGTDLTIVTAKAQTTRERVLGIHSDSQQGQILFLDTPGLHQAKAGGINAFMVAEARAALEGADLVWCLVDPQSRPVHESVVMETIQGIQAPVFLLFNKQDLKKPMTQLEAAYRAKFPAIRIFYLSALKKKGVDALLAETFKLLPEGPLFYDDLDVLSDKPTRYFIAEKIRKQLYLHLGEELPYSCAIVLNKVNESAKPMRIEATVFVERDSQKGMVIGQGAKKIKEIGQAARTDLEDFLGQKVFLGLRVDVLKDWTKTQSHLKKLGYYAAL